MEQEFIISKKLAEGTLNYLASRPYAEVAALINGLQNIQPVEEPAPKAESKKKE